MLKIKEKLQIRLLKKKDFWRIEFQFKEEIYRCGLGRNISKDTAAKALRNLADMIENNESFSGGAFFE